MTSIARRARSCRAAAEAPEPLRKKKCRRGDQTASLVHYVHGETDAAKQWLGKWSFIAAGRVRLLGRRGRRRDRYTDRRLVEPSGQHQLARRLGEHNYFYKISASCVNVRMAGYSLIEANYFESVVNPVTSRDSSAVGFWDLRRNNLASAADVAESNQFGISWDAGNSGTVNATDWTTTAAYPVALGYAYQAQPFQCIHDGLRATAGAGKGLVTLSCK